MNFQQPLISLTLMTMMFFSTLPAMGQASVTKSGTVVTPVESHSIITPAATKSSSSQACPTMGTYIVVTTPDLLPSLQPLLRWRRQQGFGVETLCVGTNKRDTIRHLLRQRFEASTPLHPAQQYVLLVGDADRIQAFIGQHTPNGLGSTVTDLYYGEYTGDYIPEAMVGRLSVTDSTELARVVEKIIDYEQGRWAEDYADILLAAGKERRSPAPTTTNGQVNYLAHLFSNYRPELDTLCFRNNAEENSVDSIVQALRQPNALVNYTSHCTRAGWDFPRIGFQTIDTLAGTLPSVYVNNCCLSNAFDGTCFGEELLRKADGGAVAVIGATNESLWNEDYYWAVGAKQPVSDHPAFDWSHAGAFDDVAIGFAEGEADRWPNMPNLGAMMHRGCQAVSQSGSVYDAYYWELYTLLGDPTTTLFLGRNDTLPMFDMTECGEGVASLQLRSAPYTRIAVTQDTLLIGTSVADADGVAKIDFAHSLVGDSVTLTATRPEATYRQQTLPLTAPAQGWVAVRDYRLCDTELLFHLRNVAGSEARNHKLVLTQDSSDLVGATLPMSEPSIIVSLPPHHDTLVALNLGTLSLGMEPLLAAHLTMTDSNDSVYLQMPVRLEMADVRPQLVSIRIVDDSLAPTLLHHGHTYGLELTLSHEADSVVMGQTRLEGQNGVWHGTFTPCDSAYHRLDFTVHRGNYAKEYRYWLPLFRAAERFETGSFDNFPWAATNWHIDSTHAHEGLFSARSAKIDHSQKTVLAIDIEVLADDSIAFCYSVSSEADDRLYFYIDGVRRGYWTGNGEWGRKSCPITAGTHHLEWVYQKDASVTERSDCAHIDDIIFPICLWDRPCGKVEEAELLSIPREADSPRFSVYPNPACGSITITCPPSAHDRQIEVYDALGRLADKIILPANSISTQYSTAHLRFGIYTLLLHGEKQGAIQKMIVTR